MTDNETTPTGVRAISSGPVALHELDEELGGQGLSADGDLSKPGAIIRSEHVTQAELEAALAAHRPSPDHLFPVVDPETPDVSFVRAADL